MKIFLSILLFICFSKICFAQNLTLSGGSWVVSVPANIVSQTGIDYSNSTLTSLQNQSMIDISSTKNWQVKVNKQDIDWNSNLSFWIRKTNDGSGIGTISPLGSTNFIQLSNFDQLFFDGSKDRNSIPIQYEIRGMSVLLPAKSYSANIVFTFIEL